MFDFSQLHWVTVADQLQEQLSEETVAGQFPEELKRLASVMVVLEEFRQ